MSFFIAIAAAAALVWAIALILRGSMAVACLVFLTVNACLGYYFLHFRAGPVELTLDRIVLLMVGAMFVLHWRAGRLQRVPLVRMDLAVIALLGWMLIRTLTSDFRNPPEGQPSPLWHWAIGYASPLFIYGIARSLPLDARTVRLVQKFLIGFGIYLAFTGLAEVTHQWWAVFPRHIADPDVGLHFGRARGPMVQSIVYGFCLSLSVAAAWVYRTELGVRAQWLLMGCIPLFLTGIFLSYTRCVWMGGAAALLIVVWLTVSRRMRIVIVGSIGVMALLLVATQWSRLEQFSGGRSADASRDSANMRVSFAYVSWQMFKDQPIAGCGFGQYMREKNPYLADRSTLALDHIRDEIHHNLFLSILVETGLIGLVLFLAMLAIWCRSAWRLIHTPSDGNWLQSHGLLMLATIGAYLPNALFQPVGHMNIVHMLFFFIAGITAGLMHHTTAPGRARLGC